MNLRRSLVLGLFFSFALTAIAQAGTLVGIIRSDGTTEPLGPYESTPGTPTQGPVITAELPPTHPTPNPNNTLDKVFRWNYQGSGIAPGDILCIMEEIPLIYPPNTPPDQKIPFITDWHERITRVQDDVMFKWVLPGAGLGASYESVPIPVASTAHVSPDGQEIWFDFTPLPIPMAMGLPADPPPLTLKIQKYLMYMGTGPITSGPGQTSVDIFVSEQPSVPEPATFVLLAIGLGCSCFYYRKRK